MCGINLNLIKKKWKCYHSSIISLNIQIKIISYFDCCIHIQYLLFLVTIANVVSPSRIDCHLKKSKSIFDSTNHPRKCKHLILFSCKPLSRNENSPSMRWIMISQLFLSIPNFRFIFFKEYSSQVSRELFF